MDHESLRTASTYLNNLLLARGLLRNSAPIDFVKPSRDSRAQIINLVHDLILREDRDREQREHVAVTLRSLRVEEQRKNAEVEKLVAREEETARAVVQAKAAERAAQTESKRVEKVVKGLQEQLGKLKTSLAQVKTQCTNDVRKRDLELARLKTHLQGQQRGNRSGMSATSITITGGGARKVGGGDATLHDMGDPEYSLKQETTDFLTQLSQSLSDENDQLINLIRGALGTMRELLGLPSMQHPDSAFGSMGSHDEDGSRNKQPNSFHQPDLLHALPTTYTALSTTLSSTLTHLSNILTNPNFVSMDEVNARDEEIARLREGWERMEQRWREVLLMMEGWRRKMDTGHTINLDDLRRGIGLVSPEQVRVGAVREEEPDQSFVNGDVSETRLPNHEELVSSLLELEPRTLQKGGSERKQSSSPTKRKRDVLEPPEFFDLRPSTNHKASPERVELPYEEETEEGEESEDHSTSNPNSAGRLTIAEKLELAHAEAEKASAAAATTSNTNGGSSSKISRPTSTTPISPVGFDGANDDAEKDDTLGILPPMSPVAKKTGVRGRPKKRRKSTLSPEELEELLLVRCEEEEGGD